MTGGLLRFPGAAALQSCTHRRNASHSRVVIRAALPLDPAALFTCAAAASSLLTAAWITASRVQPGRETAEPGPPAPEAAPSEQPVEADSVQRVWAAAWAPFSKQPQGQQVAAAGEDGQTSPYESEPVATRPLLLLQGIKRSARVQLLALALAALEQHIEALPPAQVLLLGGPQWRDACAALLASASLAAAAAWLGYIPEELQEAVHLQLSSLDPSVLAAVGIGRPASPGAGPIAGAGAAAVADDPAEPPADFLPSSWLSWLTNKPQQSRDSSADPLSGGSSSSGSTSTSTEAAAARVSGTGPAAGARGGESTHEDGSSTGPGGGSRHTRLENFYWVGLRERLPLYCSVLRLLRSHSIAQQAQQGAVAQGRQEAPLQQQQPQQQQWRHAASTGAQSPKGLPYSSDLAPPGAAVLEAVPPGLGSAGAGPVDARQEARGRLQGGAAGVPVGLRGWRATSAGVKSPSQLLTLAPSVLHDMAVMVAEAVAAGYCADVDGGLDPAATLRSAAALRAAAGGTLGSAGSEGEAARGLVASSSGGGSGRGSSYHGNSSSNVIGDSSLPGSRLAEGTLTLVGANALHPEGSAEGYLEAEEGGLVPLEASYWPTYTHRQLSSTRQLQRFTNQVVLQRWVAHYYSSVAALYEDRMDLFGLGEGAMLQVRRVPLRRVSELNSLRGVRFAMSLLLELADLAVPALRALWRRATAFVSWLLVSLIGKSLGLIYQGIRMSPTSQPRQQQPKRAGRRRQQGQQPGPDAQLAEGGEGWPGSSQWGWLF